MHFSPKMSTKLNLIKGKKQENTKEKLVLIFPEGSDNELPILRSLFKAFIDGVSDITFGNPVIAKYIEEGSLSLSDGMLSVLPSIQNDEVFSWWITTLIGFTAKAMLSIEEICPQDRTAIYSSLCRLSPYLSHKADVLKKKSASCKKCHSNEASGNPDRSQSAKENSPKMQIKCPGSQCPRRKKMQCEFDAQAQTLKKYWRLVRQCIQRLMRNEPIATPDVKKVVRNGHVVALTMRITALCKLDPHQLYKRLECVSTEHVMQLKMCLWEFLVTPNKVACLKRFYDAKAAANIIAIAQAKYFIKALLDEFSKFQESVKKVSTYLVVLEEEYLKHSGITWKVINHHIFDKVIYQDELFKSFLPAMENALEMKLTGDCTIQNPHPLVDEEVKRQFPDLFSGVPELVKSFQLFHRLMLTSREMFRRADLLMQTFVKQQRFLHSRAKVEILEKDFDFFTQMRRMIRKSVCDSKKLNFETYSAEMNFNSNNVQINRIVDEEADEAEFIRRFKDLLDYGQNPTGQCKSLDESKREIICKYCNQSHCWCDECSFYHMILCGLMDKDVDTMGLDIDVDDLRMMFFDGILDEKFYDKTTKRPLTMEEYIIREAKRSSSNENSSDFSQLKNDSSDVNTSSLFTLHENAQPDKQIIDPQSSWDVRTLDYYFATCKCEVEDSDEENCHCSKLSSTPSGKSLTKRQVELQQRLNSRILSKKSLLKRTVSGTWMKGSDLLQEFISEDKKSLVHIDKKGICVTQITKATSRSLFEPKRLDDIDDSSSDDLVDSEDELDEDKVDMQRISVNIFKEIEKSLANYTESENLNKKNFDSGSNSSSTINKDCFSSFFGSGCRKLIENLMKKTIENSEVRPPILEDDTDESLSIDSSIGRCSHEHDHHDSCQASNDDQRERLGRCDCCYCSYIANDMPPRHESRRNEEIRQRLRKVLKQREENTRGKNSVSSDGRVSAEVESEPKNNLMENRTVDELLEFINEKGSNENSSSTKAVKKARQKQRKLEEKLKKMELEKVRKEKDVQNVPQAKNPIQNDVKVSTRKNVEKSVKSSSNTKEKFQQKEDNKNADRSDNKKPEKKYIAVSDTAKDKKIAEKILAKSDDISSFVTPTKLARAFEENFVVTFSTSQKKEEKPKTFKSQAALASKAVQGNKRNEPKVDKHLANPNRSILTSTASTKPNASLATGSSAATVNEKGKNGLQTKSTKENEGRQSTNSSHFKTISENTKGSQAAVIDSKTHREEAKASRSNVLQVTPKTNSLSNASSKMSSNDYSSSLFNNEHDNFMQPITLVVNDLSDEEALFLRRRAAMIAAAATATGATLPPLSSLTPEQQQKYFAWIKQIEANIDNPKGTPTFTETPTTISNQSVQRPASNSTQSTSRNPSAGAIGNGRPSEKLHTQKTTSELSTMARQHLDFNNANISQFLPSPHLSPVNGKSLGAICEAQSSDQLDSGLNETNPLQQAAVPTARFGAIGEKPIPRKTFNPYAAYDRETNCILGLSHSPLSSFITPLSQSPIVSTFMAGRSLTPTQKPATNQITPTTDTMIQNANVYEGSAAANVWSNNGIDIQSNLPSAPALAYDGNSLRRQNISIWQNDDNAKRFLESEECAVFKFFDS